MESSSKNLRATLVLLIGACGLMMQLFGPPLFFPQWINSIIFILSFALFVLALLFLLVPSWFKKAEKWLTWKGKQDSHKEPENTASDQKVIEPQRKAEERQKNLRRYWEADPKDGRKAARLMLAVDFGDAEDIYKNFAPFDDDGDALNDDTKRYRWAVSYAWAYHLVIAGESDQADDILEEAEYCAGFLDKSYRCQDSKDDIQEFYVEPLEKSGYQIEENDE